MDNKCKHEVIIGDIIFGLYCYKCNIKLPWYYVFKRSNHVSSLTHAGKK